MSGQEIFSSGYGGEVIAWAERISPHQPVWVFISVFMLLSGLAWIRMAYGSMLQTVFESGGNYQVAARIFKDSNLLHKQLENLLSAYYFLSTSLFLYYIELTFSLLPYGFSGLSLFGFNLAFLLTLSLLRFVSLRLSGALFGQEALFREYFYNTQIYNKILGIILPPLLLVSLYSNGVLKLVVMYLLLGLLAAFVILRLIRGLVFSFKKDVSKFYMFLYLCALEMAPLVLLYRWLEAIL